LFSREKHITPYIYHMRTPIQCKTVFETRKSISTDESSIIEPGYNYYHQVEEDHLYTVKTFKKKISICCVLTSFESALKHLRLQGEI